MEEEAMKNIDRKVDKMGKDVEMQSETVKFLAQYLDNQKKSNRSNRYFLYFVIVVLLLTNIWSLYMSYKTSVVETTEETTTTSQEGVYNFKDSEGNIISSDMSLEEMKELVEINGEGQNGN